MSEASSVLFFILLALLSLGLIVIIARWYPRPQWNLSGYWRIGGEDGRDLRLRHWRFLSAIFSTDEPEGGEQFLARVVKDEDGRWVVIGSFGSRELAKGHVTIEGEEATITWDTNIRVAPWQRRTMVSRFPRLSSFPPSLHRGLLAGSLKTHWQKRPLIRTALAYVNALLFVILCRCWGIWAAGPAYCFCLMMGLFLYCMLPTSRVTRVACLTAMLLVALVGDLLAPWTSRTASLILLMCADCVWFLMFVNNFRKARLAMSNLGTFLADLRRGLQLTIKGLVLLFWGFLTWFYADLALWLMQQMKQLQYFTIPWARFGVECVVIITTFICCVLLGRLWRCRLQFSASDLEIASTWPRMAPHMSEEERNRVTQDFMEDCEAYQQMYPFSLDIESVFKIEDADTNFTALPDTCRERCRENIQWLYHGTHGDACRNIVEHGFQLPRIAKTGSMFGKGIYFADCPLKSWQYSDSSRYILICAVALGEERGVPKANDTLNVQSLRRALTTNPNSFAYDSVRGMTQRSWTSDGERGVLRLPEFIVYRTEQIAPAYLVKAREVH